MGEFPKKRTFFDSVRDRLKYGEDYRIYSCRSNDNLISALLLFYFNKTVEYFTPVIKKDFRHLQPLSLIIFKAMIDSCANGYKYWNWGGTWVSQDSVYLFKSRWGTKDYPYYYYTKVYDMNIINRSRELLLQEYPYFFVLPFNKLKVVS